jgi:putative ABC transport system permease protein
MWQDVQFGLRTLSKNPGFTAIAVAALALGIGVNATVFSLANAILYKNLPFTDSDRVLYPVSANVKTPRAIGGLSYPELRDLQEQSKTFNGIGASVGCPGNFADATAYPENYRCRQITANTFSVIGQTPALGRDFTADDEREGATPVAILSYGLWEKRYGKDASIIGRAVRINSVPTTVIGVMPRGFEFPPETQFWEPLIPTALLKKRDARDLSPFARLAPGVPPGQARAEIATIGANLARQYPETNRETIFQVRSFTEVNLKGQIRNVFLTLLGAVGFVLLIACANVANLMLARAVGRTREISIRTALGAGRWRVMRQLLVESLLLSIAGGALGILIAQWGTRAFDAAVIPTGKPAWVDFSIDYRALAYCAAITLASSIVFGLAPALRLAKLDINSGLKDGGYGAGLGGRRHYLANSLVVAEVALSVILLVGAGLMIRSFLNAYETPVGYDISRILTMRLDPSPTKYPKDADAAALYSRVTEQVAAVPGVESVALASSLMGNGMATASFELEGAPPIDARRRPSTLSMTVSLNYFDALHVGPTAGRTFTPADSVSGSPVAVVSRGFAQTHLAGKNPIGARLRTFDRAGAGQWFTVVGVVPDITQSDFTHNQADPLVYFAFPQKPQRWMSLMVSTRLRPGSLGDACRRSLQNVDPDLSARDVIPMEQQFALASWPLRVFGSMFAIFAAIALLLASVGLYAVVAHVVSQRTREIGIRVALGASRRKVMRMVFVQGMTPMAIGLAIGLAAAFGVSRVLAGLLSGVSATDPATFSLVAVVLLIAAVIGCALPARRAVRVDPMEALRQE